MRALQKPDLSAVDLYKLCADGISDVSLKTRIHAIEDKMLAHGQEYDVKGNSRTWFTLTPNNQHKDSVIIDNVTKKEITDLYTLHMVGKVKPAREIYNKLLASTSSGKCPYCGMGHIYTIDHYLPKSKYPFFGILPLNLVPSCRDCNIGKSNAYASRAEDQPLHPYYDHGKFISDQWLFASVVQAAPATVRFYVSPPEQWDGVSKSRVLSHFNDYSLAKRYAIESADQMTIIRYTLLDFYKNASAIDIKNYLVSEAKRHEMIHKNSWQTALHWALSQSDWYVNGGYR